MRFLALATSDDDAFARLTPAASAAGARAEARRAWQLRQDGTIVEISFRTDRHDVVILLEAVDAEHAREALATLPFVRDGLVTFEVIGLVPYRAWEGVPDGSAPG
jgi:hypothetical protein